MTHILHIIQALSLGGAARSMIAVAKYSSQSGAYRHSVIALQMADPQAVALAEEAGMTVLVTPDETSLERELREADIVQVQYWNNPEVFAFLHRMFPPMRFILWYHIAGNGSPQIITPELAALPDVNIPCNPFTFYDLPVFRDMPAEQKRTRAVLAYDAADFDRVRNVKLRPHEGFNVGYIGTVDFVKMHRNFVPMSAAVNVPGVKFIVCGGGIEDQLKREAAALGAAEKFDFRGYVQDIAAVIAQLDVYGYPLCEDTYAAAELNLQEVMYAGVPPVVFPYGGIRRLVEHNVTGLVVNSESEYTEAIDYLYRNPDERMRLGANAAEYARKVFGAENAARVMNELYGRLAAQPKRQHAWGHNPDIPLLEQQLRYRDIAGEAEHLSGAELFVESLGETAPEFSVSLGGGTDYGVLRAEQKIMRSTHLVLQTGLVPYSQFVPEDAFLHLWTGLAHEGRGEDGEALAAYLAALQAGMKEWRVYWYLARVLERNGRSDQSSQLFAQLRASVPQFDHIIQTLDIPEEPVVVQSEEYVPDAGMTAEKLFAEVMNEGGESTLAETPLSEEELFAELMALDDEDSSSPDAQTEIVVSAIVSTYNSERYIAGCLQDLVEQTLFRKGGLEIVVVDSGSQQNEGAIVRRFAEQYPNIRYIRTERETIYAAWNRGVQAASGRYLTNANTDDRHKDTALERMAAELDRRPDVALVYADSLVTESENDRFETASICAALRYPQFDRRLLFQLCYIGPHPMWRKSLHERYGLFDGAMKSAGDYEFWLRFCRTETMYHIPETLGLYLRSENSVEWSNVGLMHQESAIARERYWPAEWGQPPVPQGSFYFTVPKRIDGAHVPLVSVIVPTYNRLQTLHETLVSLEQQVFRDFEVIVVNDAGEDVNAVLDGFRSSLTIVSMRHDDNRGLPAARNTGIRVARGKYIAYLDDDDVYYPHHLETLVRVAQLSGSRVVYSNAVHLQYRNEESGKVMVSRDVPYAFDFSRDRFLYENYTPVLCVMHERACLDVVGEFDESFRKALEDWDLWVRLSQSYDFYHVNVVTCEFRTCVDPERLARLDRSGFAENSRRIFEKYRKLTEHRPDIQQLQQGYLAGLEQIERRNRAAALQVSIIIPTLNNIDYTRQCIDGIRQTAGDVSYEIIVVDNGSTDGTRDYLAAEMNAGRLRAIFNDRNETFSHANNQGAEVARGNYLLFLNNDTKPLPGWLHALVETFEHDATIGVQGGRLLYPNNTIQHAGIVYGRVQTGSLMHYHIYLCMPHDAPCVNKGREFQMVTGAMLAIRRELYEHIGGFDEHYVFGHEDLDICLAARKYGSKVWYNPQFAAYHFESMTKKSEGIEKFELRLQDPDSIDAKNYHYFHKKWDDVLAVDADNYYAEDGFIQAVRSETSVQKTQSGKPRILMTMYGWKESGGGTTFPRAVARRYAELGYETIVFYAAGVHSSVSDPYHLEEIMEDGVRLFGVYNRPTVFLDEEQPSREVYDQHVVQLFARVLDTFRPDVVHFHNFLGLSFAIADEAKRRGIPTVYTPHNYHMIDPMLYMFRSDLSLWQSTDLLTESEVVRRLPDKVQAFRQRISAAQRLLTTAIDHTIAVSTRQRDLLAEFCGDASRLSVVHQVHETVDRIRTDRGQRASDRPVRFGFIGGAMPHKGVHVLVQAAQVLRGKAEVLIYGFVSDQYRAQLEQMDRYTVVRWMGAYGESDLPDIARELDAVIVPSVWEDCAPLVLLEAIAMELPVIGANIGGIPDVVQDGVNGRLYEYDRPEQLSALLLHYAEHPDELRRMARNCVIPYHFGDYVQHLLSVYERLARKEQLSDSDISLYCTAGISTKEEPMDTAMNRIQFSHNLQGGFSNRRATGVLPQPLPQTLYLNLGCGRDVRDDCINIDLFSDDPRVVGMDVRNLGLPDNCADGIIASDILEHFSHREVDAVLKEWARVLKPGGELVVRCPSLRLQVKAYMDGVWDADIASYMIFGGQTNPGDYHCIGFDERSITKHLAQAGLSVFFFEEVDTPQTQGFINLNMTVRAHKQAVQQPVVQHAVQQPVVQHAAQQPAVQQPVAQSHNYGREANDIQQPAIPARERTGKAELNIVWEGSQFVAHSLALINREHCYNILRSGVADLTIVPYEIDEFSPGGNEKFEQLQAHDIRYKKDALPEAKNMPYIWIRHQWPPKFEAPKGARWIVMQPWEFSSLRRDFVEAFRQADEVWTPSSFARNVFVNSGLDFNKVQVVPNGINPRLFTPFGAVADLPTKKNFRFLFVGGTIFRKGIDILLEAYAKAFTAEDDVCLVIKDMGGRSFYRGQTAQQTIAEFRRKPNAPEIVYIDKTMTEEEMAGLYRACQVFVSPYRGEGFSLPTLEAMACGLPVIVTEGGATDDFVDEEAGWLIPADTRSLGSVIDGHQLTGEAFVLEPKVDALVELMETAFNHPTEGARRGRMGSLRARTQWTWNRATLKMLARLDVLYGTGMARTAEATLVDTGDGVIDVCRAEQAYIEGRIDDAVALYQAAVEQRGLPPEYVLLTLHRLASIALVDGEPELAEEFLEKARTVDSGHPDTLYIQSLVHAWRQEWEKELDILEPLLDRWKTARLKSRIGIELDTLLCDMGRALYTLGIIEDAKEVYTLALGVNNENPDACYGAALCFARLGAADEARTMLEWAVRLRPDFDAAREALEEMDA